MLYRNMFNKYYAAADDGTGAGGAGDETVTAKTYTQEEVDELTKGLKESRDTLLSEKKTVSQKAKEAEEARLALELESARKLGEFGTVEKSLKEQFSKREIELTEKIKARDDLIATKEKRALIAEFSEVFSRATSSKLLNDKIKVSLVDGDLKVEYLDHDGLVVSSDKNEYIKWMAKDDEFSHLMKADGASGGGAIGAKNNASGGAVAKSTADILYPQK